MVIEAEFVQNWQHRKSKLTIHYIKWNGWVRLWSNLLFGALVVFLPLKLFLSQVSFNYLTCLEQSKSNITKRGNPSKYIFLFLFVRLRLARSLKCVYASRVHGNQGWILNWPELARVEPSPSESYRWPTFNRGEVVMGISISSTFNYKR